MSREREPLTIDKRVGARVRARRLEVGLSQERLAAMLGITFQQIQKYEKGVNRIAAGRLFDISRALDMPIAAFFDESERRVESKPALVNRRLQEALAVSGSIELLALYASLKGSRRRQQALAFIRRLSEESGA